MAALTIENVKKSYGSTQVLKGINIDIEKGEFLVLIGPSGCGKSTMMNSIAGLETITEGRILIGGEDVTHANPKDRDIAMVFQSYALYPNMTVRQNISFGLEVRKMPKAEREIQVDKVAKLLQLELLLDRKPAQLSGGQRQRVAMGRAIAREPKIYLFDEPLSNLDAKLRVEMRAEIKKLHQRLGTTIVYVTHDQVEAMTLADRIAVMRDGTLQQLATPQEIYDRPVNVFVAGFMGSPPMNFITAKIESETLLSIETKGETYHLPITQGKALASYIGKEVTLGIRPEMITEPLAHKAALDYVKVLNLTPLLTEAMGADTMVLTQFGDMELKCRVNPSYLVEVNKPCEFMFDMSKAVFFDPETEELI
ncbi:MAG: sn-glycerol-3-phosphate ABC transporter ATP-binding protein UgpC [Oceanospirillaceae bacterium]|nr:sn-glycerol-3-phosphate ABC transporter ATP-binding protein UgpC [Oceanospirillaceae bacterium]